MDIKNICINPGHCPGIDPGACGNYSTEADIVKRIGAVLQKDLQKIGYNVTSVQDDSLAYICQTSNNMPADIFVSIHCNSAEAHDAVGTEVFHYYSSSQAAADLAQCIQSQIVNSLGTVDRGVKEAGFYVIKVTDCPAVLVETGFISNPAEEKLLNDHIEDFAHAIARGITDFHQRG